MENLIKAYNEYFTVTLNGPYDVFLHYKHSIPVVGIVVYAMILLLLPKLLSKGMNVQTIMIYWNLFLSTISVVMFLGVTIPYSLLVYKHGFFAIFCDVGFKIIGEPSPMVRLKIKKNKLFWCCLFAFSKFFELFDTVLLILKHPTKSVPFLHWYHHFTVLLFTWYAEIYKYSAGILFIGNSKH
jgi:elongation of very long chain fatty acids protein 6